MAMSSVLFFHVVHWRKRRRKSNKIVLIVSEQLLWCWLIQEEQKVIVTNKQCAYACGKQKSERMRGEGRNGEEENSRTCFVFVLFMRKSIKKKKQERNLG